MLQRELSALTRQVGFEIIDFDALSQISGSWAAAIQYQDQCYRIVSDRLEDCFGLWQVAPGHAALVFGTQRHPLTDRVELQMLATWLPRLRTPHAIEGSATGAA